MEQEREDEAKWIALASQGDEKAFTMLFNHYYTMIYSHCYRLALDQSVAEDLAQTVFIKAARNLASFRGPHGFKSWLYTIASHCFHDWLRKHSREHAIRKDWESLQPYGGSDRTGYDDLHQAVGSLPPHQREATILVYLENLSHREAAAVMDCAETTVSWHLCLARRTLRKTLGQTL
ncbi:MAG: RNA polymerase sigma factor [Candidatus Methylacidiphilales bacterium]